jgi:hypothetical protein
MSIHCHSAADEGQSEFAFFQQLVTSTDVNDCCGQLNTLAFTGHALNTLSQALLSGGIEMDLDSIDHQVLDSGYLGISMCSKHWLMHIHLAGKQGINSKNEYWVQLTTYLYRLICVSNKWDHKDLTNYLKSYSDLRKKNND